jgi:glyoxylase-like metal-dependent hydrolase (beta-lactamase superfamily II)
MTTITSMPSSTALPVARDWFRMKPAGDALTVIDEPHVHEPPRANSWLIRGQDRDLLFDSGLGLASLRTALDGIISPDPVLVLSHAHLDHMGSAHEFPDCRDRITVRTGRACAGCASCLSASSTPATGQASASGGCTRSSTST